MNQAELFCSNMVHEYLENCNYQIFEQYMDLSASVIGTGGSEFFPSLPEFVSSIQREEMARGGNVCFLIQKEQYWSREIVPNLYLVLIRLLVKSEREKGEVFCEMEFRFSTLLKKEKSWRVLHIHQSSPDPNQAPGEFFPNGMIESINEQLKMLVAQQTKRLREMNEKLTYTAQHDDLTGLYNRSYLERSIIYSIQKNPLPGDILVLLDVDDFKQCNDQYGHFTGDKVLIAVGNWMQDEFPDGVAARFGGDEFAMYLGGSRKSRQEFENRLQQAFASLRKNDFIVQHNITVSAGVAIREAGENLESLYRGADKALYQAKRRGKNSYAVYCK